jgi:hypothetical protein
MFDAEPVERIVLGSASLWRILDINITDHENNPKYQLELSKNGIDFWHWTEHVNMEFPVESWNFTLMAWPGI